MSISREMGAELIGTLSRFIKGGDDDTPFRPAAQEAELKSRECYEPRLGEVIARLDFPFLIETLMLNDAVFNAEFPGLALTAEERKGLANDLERHCEDCPRCGLARAYDLEWQSRVDGALAENKAAVGHAIARALGET